METVTCTASLALAANTTFSPIEQHVRKYEPLMRKIALSFGFCDTVLHELVENTCSSALRHYETQEMYFSLRIWMSKLIVQKCVSKISASIFQQIDTSSKEMPLSFRTVYLLNVLVGFDEYEMALLLNSTPIIIRARLNKALSIISHH
jgi:hypothetical protein